MGTLGMEPVERKKKSSREHDKSLLELIVPIGIEEACRRLVQMDKRKKFLRLRLRDYIKVDTWPLSDDECEFQLSIIRSGRGSPSSVTLNGRLSRVDENRTLLTAESNLLVGDILKELIVILIAMTAFFGIIAQSLDLIPIVMFFLIFAGIFSWVAANNTRDRLFREVAYQLSRTN